MWEWMETKFCDCQLESLKKVWALQCSMYYSLLQHEPYLGYSLDLRPDPRGRVWGITLLGSVYLECHGFWIQQTSPFRSTWLVRYYSNFQNFYVLLYIRFLSLIELEHWLAEVMFIPSSTLTAAFQHSRHFQARLSPDPSSLVGAGVQTILALFTINQVHSLHVASQCHMQDCFWSVSEMLIANKWLKGIPCSRWRHTVTHTKLTADDRPHIGWKE